ncbi:MAG: GNAT family N-acetyltransferase [Treponema sp.]|jgi:GNAT superfamily N-acetyltransferase|nr:GNAT family N-acetyltransferase [Treponema sp.]
MDIKTMAPEHLEEAVTLLVSAFQDRPFYQYIAPDQVERREFLTLNFRNRLEHSLGAGDIELAFQDRRLTGIAVWSPPLNAPPPEDHSLEEAFSVFSPGLQERFFGFFRILMAARDQTIRQPYWSLAPIAVLPEEQGKGIASALIRKKLREIDASRIACFLGTQDAVNLDIYARYGFQKVREDPLAPGRFHYTMIRPKQERGCSKTSVLEQPLLPTNSKFFVPRSANQPPPYGGAGCYD